MQTFAYTPMGVCAKQIVFGLEDGKLHNIAFMGGCPGNLQAIAKLLEGESASRAISLLKGNTCGSKSTSCADQLACALEEALAHEAQG